MTRAELIGWTPPADEADARVELAAAYRMADDLGWTDLGATHFSLAVPGEDAYLVLEQGLFFDEVTPENLIKVGVDGEIRCGPPGGSVNPAGTTIHRAVHTARPDVTAVLHTHTAAGVAVANHPRGLLALSQHALRFYDGHGIHPYEGVALDDDEGPRLAGDLGGHELLLLRNHGLLAVGATMPEAFSALYYAETAARFQVASLAGTAAPVEVASDVAAHARKQYDAGMGYAYRDWAGLLRKLERDAG